MVIRPTLMNFPLPLGANSAYERQAEARRYEGWGWTRGSGSFVPAHSERYLQIMVKARNKIRGPEHELGPYLLAPEGRVTIFLIAWGFDKSVARFALSIAG